MSREAPPGSRALETGPRTSVLLALACALAACPPDASVGVPNKVAAQLTSFDSIAVTFEPPSGADAIEAEGRVGAGAWEPLANGPGNSNLLTIALDASAPEASDYAFRLRARRGGSRSDWSSIAYVHRGVRPPTNLAVSAQYDQPIQLAWTRGSTQAVEVRIDRRLVASTGTAGGWSLLATVALDATAYVDADTGAWSDGASFDYRVVYVKGVDERASAIVRSLAARPLAPVGLACAAAGVDAIRLTWTPRSHYATKQVVIRSPRWGPGTEEIATLPGDATSYLDAVPAPGAYGYRISARVGDQSAVVNFVADGDLAGGFTLLPDLPLTASWFPFPAGDQAVRGADGRFATVVAVPGPPTDAVRTWRETDTGWISRDATLGGYAALAHPAILGDPAGGLHVLYAQLLADTWQHDTFDAGAWTTESIPAALPQDAALDPAGALHVIACNGFADYATNASGAWVTERLPATAFVDRCALAVAPDGAPRVAYTSPQPVAPGAGGSSTSSDVYLLRRSGTGWTEELVPLAGASQRYATLLRVFAPSAERTVVLYEPPASAIADIPVGAVERDASGWGAPVAIGLRRFNGAPDSFAAAVSPDGRRVAIAWNGTTYQGSGSPATLAVRTTPGSWSTWTLHETGLGVALGFTPGGKPWVLDGLGGGSLPGGILYEEQ
jgi:hypothetical protein